MTHTYLHPDNNGHFYPKVFLFYGFFRHPGEIGTQVALSPYGLKTIVTFTACVWADMGGCIYWMAYFRLYWAFGNTPNEQSQMIATVKQPIVGFSNRRFTLNQSFVKNNCLRGYCYNPGEHLCTNGRCPVCAYKGAGSR